jgi:hypothetical protein
MIYRFVRRFITGTEMFYSVAAPRRHDYAERVLSHRKNSITFDSLVATAEISANSVA